MKKIYVAHSTDFNYRKGLYKALKKITEVNFVFPHEKHKKSLNSKEIIRKCSAMIADVSKPSHGVGIELGWANTYKIPIILIFKKGSKPSSSLRILSKNFISYNEIDLLVPKLQKLLKEI